MFEPASLFFPVFILALILSLLGVWRKSFWMLIAGAVLSVPMTIYLAGTSDFRLFAWLIPLALVGSAFAVRRQKTWLAWLLLLPLVITLALLVTALAVWMSIGS